MKATTRAILDRLGNCQKHGLGQDADFIAFLNESDSDSDDPLPEASTGSAKPDPPKPGRLNKQGATNSSTRHHGKTQSARINLIQKHSAFQELLERTKCVLTKSSADSKAESSPKNQSVHKNAQPSSTELPVRVTISMLGGAVAKLDVQCCTRVRTLKQQIKTLGYPFVGNVYATMLLMHDATVLDDEMSICELDAQHTIDLQLLHVHDRQAMDMVKAVVRCRPMRSSDIGSRRTVSANSSSTVVLDSCERNCSKKVFTYDAVIDESVPQEQVFEMLAAPLLDDLLDGYNATIMAYGQTSSGKSYTMFGPGPECMHSKTEEKGLLPRTFHYLFTRMHGIPATTWQINCSLIEICNETIFDLLSPDCCRLDLKTNVTGLAHLPDRCEVAVKGPAEMEQILLFGMQRSSQFPTEFAPSVNRVQDKARTHTIFTIKVEALDSCGQIRKAELNMVELMGCERRSKKALNDDRLKCAVNIGYSLSALGNVIAALTDGKSAHTPYRDSKVTRLLQDSLGGNCQTLFIAHVQSEDRHYGETLSTLRYAQRARLIKNFPQLNVSSIAKASAELPET